MPAKSNKYDDEEEKFNCTPGTPYEAFKVKLMNRAAGDTDDRGYSLADHFLDMDEGGSRTPTRC